jgi:hypothetical protein
VGSSATRSFLPATPGQQHRRSQRRWNSGKTSGSSGSRHPEGRLLLRLLSGPCSVTPASAPLLATANPRRWGQPHWTYRTIFTCPYMPGHTPGLGCASPCQWAYEFNSMNQGQGRPEPGSTGTCHGCVRSLMAATQATGSYDGNKWGNLIRGYGGLWGEPWLCQINSLNHPATAVAQNKNTTAQRVHQQQ